MARPANTRTPDTRAWPLTRSPCARWPATPRRRRLTVGRRPEAASLAGWPGAAGAARRAGVAGRRLGLVLLVPVLSATLTAGLFFAGYAHDRATGCSGRESAAVEELAPPPGTSIESRGEYIEGCVARTDMDLSGEDIVEHYEAELARLGWRETPGSSRPGSARPRSRMACRSRWRSRTRAWRAAAGRCSRPSWVG